MQGMDISDQIENVDYVMIGGVPMTPANVRGRFDYYREKMFDREITAKPVVSESRRARHPEQLSPERREYLDNAPYDFSSSSSESRFKTEFDFYAALIRASEDNADSVFQLKRKMTAQYHAVHALFVELFDMCLNDYGAKTMGSNRDDRKAWFHMKYPALFKIDQMFDAFIEEIDIELERWQQFSAAASRGLTATEMSYRATGRLYDRRSGKYDVD